MNYANPRYTIYIDIIYTPTQKDLHTTQRRPNLYRFNNTAT